MPTGHIPEKLGPPREVLCPVCGGEDFFMSARARPDYPEYDIIFALCKKCALGEEKPDYERCAFIVESRETPDRKYGEYVRGDQAVAKAEDEPKDVVSQAEIIPIRKMSPFDFAVDKIMRERGFSFPEAVKALEDRTE